MFHQFYTQKTGVFSADYIPDDLYYCFVDPYYNNWSEASYIDNRCYYTKLFPDTKQPESIAYRMNNLWFLGNGLLSNYHDVRVLLMQEEEFFIKRAVDSDGGHGVTYINDNNRELIDDIIKDISKDLIIQKPVRQHPILAYINASSVNTIRTLSFLDENGVIIYSSILRMGIHGAKVDNASSGGITCGINDDGTLKATAYSATGEAYTVHPDSNTPFSDMFVPSFSKIKDMVCRLHPTLAHYRLISWDIAVGEDGEPVLIEANLHYGELDFHQLNNGPLFGEDTDKRLAEVFSIADTPV